jgi:hypothetical protein
MSELLNEINSPTKRTYSDRRHPVDSRQHLKDFIYSMKAPYGSIYRTGSVEGTTPAPGAGDYVKANINTSLSTSHLMSSPVGNRLVYTGRGSRHFHIVASISMTSALSQVTAGFKLAKNDLVLDSSVNTRRINTNTDIGATAIHGDVILDTDEYIELWLTNETSATAINIEECYLFAMGMFI